MGGRHALRVAVVGAAVGLAAAWSAVGTRVAAQAPGPSPVVGSAPRVRVLSFGSGPRVPVRLSVTTGAFETEQVQVERSLTNVSGKARETTPLPMVSYARLAVAYFADPNGPLNVLYSPFAGFVFFVAGLPPDQAAQLSAAEMDLGSVTADLTMSTTGEILSGTVQKSPTDPSATPLTAQLAQDLTNLSVPASSQPLGIGARWRATTVVPLSGGLTETWTYTLLSWHGTILRLGLKLTQFAPPGSLRLVSTGPNSAQVTADVATGSGIETRDLEHLLPPQADLTVTEHQTLRVTNGTGTRRIDQYLRSHETGTLQP
jgi:hypothetical protein